MGHRASYILIEDGGTHIYGSTIGTLTVAQDVLLGPGGTAQYMRSLSPHDTLYDHTWGEGGILLDVDQKRLLLWGGQQIAGKPYLRRVYLTLLRPLWQGWQVEWAAQEMVDFARYIGVDPSTILNEPYAPPYIYSNNSVPIAALLTIRDDHGQIQDYSFAEVTERLLLSGERYLQSILAAHKPISLPHEHSNIDGGAYLDLGDQEMWVWNRGAIDPRYLDALSDAWDGWRIHYHIEGLARQAVLSGRDPRPIMVPNAEAVAEVIDDLAMVDIESVDPLGVIKRLTGISVPVTTSSYLSNVPNFTRAAQERRRILEQFLVHHGVSAETSDTTMS